METGRELERQGFEGDLERDQDGIFGEDRLLNESQAQRPVGVSFLFQKTTNIE